MPCIVYAPRIGAPEMPLLPSQASFRHAQHCYAASKWDRVVQLPAPVGVVGLASPRGCRSNSMAKWARRARKTN